MRPHLDETVSLRVSVIVRHERGAHHLAKVAENGTQVLRIAKRKGGEGRDKKTDERTEGGGGRGEGGERVISLDGEKLRKS